jgi:HAD superfamily hydrolase (TIGR01509 family)
VPAGREGPARADNDDVAVEAVIFDFDGLLMDTESAMLDSWRNEWRQHGLDLDLDTFFADHGGDMTPQRYARLARAVGPDFDQAASQARRIAYRNRLLATLGLAPGIARWLDQARELGLRLAVASSSPGSWVRGLLAGVQCLDRFEVMACGDEVSRPKPDPGVYLLALERLALPAARVIAVEDAPHGVAAAQAAGMRCVAIPNHHASPVRFAAADLLLTSAAEVGLGQVLARLG